MTPKGEVSDLGSVFCLDIIAYNVLSVDAQRTERMARTRVSVLEYPLEGETEVTRKEFKTSSDLKGYLTSLEKQDSSKIKLRQFVVEDLSRDVIELLGGHYDVNPSFFREHLVDYVWYNISRSFFYILAYTGFSAPVADTDWQRTGGEKHRILTLCLEAKTGSKCASRDLDTS